MNGDKYFASYKNYQENESYKIYECKAASQNDSQQKIQCPQSDLISQNFVLKREQQSNVQQQYDDDEDIFSRYLNENKIEEQNQFNFYNTNNYGFHLYNNTNDVKFNKQQWQQQQSSMYTLNNSSMDVNLTYDIENNSQICQINPCENIILQQMNISSSKTTIDQQNVNQIAYFSSEPWKLKINDKLQQEIKQKNKQQQSSNDLRKVKKNYLKNICRAIYSYMQLQKDEIKIQLDKMSINPDKFYKKYLKKQFEIQNIKQFYKLFSKTSNGIICEETYKYKSALRMIAYSFLRKEIVSYSYCGNRFNYPSEFIKLRDYIEYLLSKC